MKVFRYLLVSMLSLLALSGAASSHYKAAPYRVTKGGATFTTTYTNPFTGSDCSARVTCS